MAEQENQLINRIANMLNSSFHGGAWHGPSVLEATKGLSPREASFKAPTVHTIAELIYHITSWRLFAIKRLQGDNKYIIDDEKKNFGIAPKVDAFELETLLMELSLSQDELLRELSKKDDAFLEEITSTNLGDTPQSSPNPAKYDKKNPTGKVDDIDIEDDNEEK